MTADDTKRLEAIYRQKIAALNELSPVRLEDLFV
jgi:hypothetical protein